MPDHQLQFERVETQQIVWKCQEPNCAQEFGFVKPEFGTPCAVAIEDSPFWQMPEDYLTYVGQCPGPAPTDPYLMNDTQLDAYFLTVPLADLLAILTVEANSNSIKDRASRKAIILLTP